MCVCSAVSQNIVVWKPSVPRFLTQCVLKVPVFRGNKLVNFEDWVF
jgi:hypothetical protein